MAKGSSWILSIASASWNWRWDNLKYLGNVGNFGIAVVHIGVYVTRNVGCLSKSCWWIQLLVVCCVTKIFCRSHVLVTARTLTSWHLMQFFIRIFLCCLFFNYSYIGPWSSPTVVSFWWCYWEVWQIHSRCSNIKCIIPRLWQYCRRSLLLLGSSNYTIPCPCLSGGLYFGTRFIYLNW